MTVNIEQKIIATQKQIDNILLSGSFTDKDIKKLVKLNKKREKLNRLYSHTGH